jgi:hypothetical protein
MATLSTYRMEGGSGLVIRGAGRFSLIKMEVEKSSLLGKLQYDARVGKSKAASGNKYRVFMNAFNGETFLREMLFWMTTEEFLDLDEDSFFELIEEAKEKSKYNFVSIETPKIEDFWVDLSIHKNGSWELILPTSSSDQSPSQHTFFPGNLGVSIIDMKADQVFWLEVPCDMVISFAKGF